MENVRHLTSIDGHAFKNSCRDKKKFCFSSRALIFRVISSHTGIYNMNEVMKILSEFLNRNSCYQQITLMRLKRFFMLLVGMLGFRCSLNFVGIFLVGQGKVFREF